MSPLIKLAVNALRRLFHSLPIDSGQKHRLLSFFYSNFPFIFRRLPSYQLWENRRRLLNQVAHMAFALPLSEVAPPKPGSIDPASVKLPTSQNPLVSIIIPVYGKIDYTLHCLRSMAKNPPDAPFEVIVVDDRSPDNTAELLGKVSGIRVVTNETNQGFIRSCNNGAGAARSSYLHFLNNDTYVCQGWLDELLRTFDEFPGTGMAGSKLIYPNAALQEAGGIIFRDGNAWNFGRGKDSGHPMFNYAREADYISGASILIKKPLFEELGRFDELYLPAYGEDSDLALKIRSRGLKVIYQPLSVVVHYEGVTSGTDLKSGVKAYQVENARKFYERWRDLLASNPDSGGSIDSAKDRGISYRVLVLDHCTPTPDQDAGSVTIFNFMLLLRHAGFQVTFIPEDNFLYVPGYTSDLQRVGIETLYTPFFSSVKQHLKESGSRYDLVFIFRPVVADRHLKLVRKLCPRAKVLYHTSDLHFLRMSREADLSNDQSKRREAEKMRKHELSVMRSVDAVIVHSSTEKELLEKESAGAKVFTFQWAIPIRGSTVDFGSRANIAFVGGYQHPPNVDAVLYFVGKIFPLLRERIPSVRFYAVGSNPPKELLDLAGPDVIVTGFVEDLASLLDTMRVAVAPLRYGAGIKGKIGTTLSLALPCVGTTIAVEGMGLRDGEEILVADSPEAFAAAVARLYNDRSLWEKISRRGMEFADREYGPSAAQKTMWDILLQLGFKPKSDGQPVKIIGPAGKKGGRKTVSLPAPVILRGLREFMDYSHTDAAVKAAKMADDLPVAHGDKQVYSVPGYCVPCQKQTLFLVDLFHGARKTEQGWTPNWRERLECPYCGLNSRMRLMAALMKQNIALIGNAGARVYMMEQVTPFYKWAVSAFPNHLITGSEYVENLPSGRFRGEIRSENLMSLSFDPESFDLLISNDLLEHVPDTHKALLEMSRVLRPGGHLVMTIPFNPAMETSVTRASLDANGVHHFLPPVYHGNPVSLDGSLVFTDFGWDVLAMMRQTGFADAWVEVYTAPDYGHLGEDLIVFRGINK